MSSKHTHKVKLLSEEPFCASVESNWLSCPDHNPHAKMSVEFLRGMMKKHPVWFEVERAKK